MTAVAKYKEEQASTQTLHEPYAEDWARAQARLSQILPEGTFKSWVEPLFAINMDAGTLVLGIQTRFMRDWVTTNYLPQIFQCCREENQKIFAVEIIVAAAPARNEAEAATQVKAAVIEKAEPYSTEGPDPNSPNFLEKVSASLDARYTFENFVVGKPNELAHAAALRVAEAETVSFNPLFLYGGVGLGKTHLMHAIAWHIKKCHPKRKVIYISAEKFMYQFIRALRFRDTVAFKDQFRSVDVLMIDDVQFISGKDSTQEEFFHTFNALVDQNRQVIVSADKSPSDLEGMEERLRSRLGWGLVADIHPTTYELRLGILQAKADHMKAVVPDKVLEFLAHKIISNVRELEGALNRIVAHSMLVGREVTIDMAQDVLRDLLRANDRRVSVDDIQRKVAEHFNLRLSDMQSTKRLRTIARPRQIAMYLAKKFTTNSLPEIGRKFGGRDHTTVMHAVKKVAELMETEHGVAEDVEILQRMLQV
jgi:chromosomal replication initiator protein